MRWILNSRGVLLLDEVTEQEAVTIKQHVVAFWAACEISPGRFRYPGIDKHLRKALLDLRDRLPNGEVRLLFQAMKPFLRWCITDGRHLQDERRDNARALWRVLFKDRFPEFVRWNPVRKEYEENIDEYLRWCSAQVQIGTELTVS